MIKRYKITRDEKGRFVVCRRNRAAVCAAWIVRACLISYLSYLLIVVHPALALVFSIPILFFEGLYAGLAEHESAESWLWGWRKTESFSDHFEAIEYIAMQKGYDKDVYYM